MAKRTSDVTESSAVEAPGLESSTDAPRHGFFVRLYTGTGAFDVIGRRKLWYVISGLIAGVCLVVGSTLELADRRRSRAAMAPGTPSDRSTVRT